MKPINLRIAQELGVCEQQVAAAVSLLDGGASVPFHRDLRRSACDWVKAAFAEQRDIISGAL